MRRVDTGPVNFSVKQNYVVDMQSHSQIHFVFIYPYVIYILIIFYKGQYTRADPEGGQGFRTPPLENYKI